MNISKIISDNKAVAIYFKGENCAPCMALQPKIKDLFEKNFPKIKLLFINPTIDLSEYAQFNIFSFPTLIVFMDRREVVRKSIYLSLPQLKGEIEKYYSLLFE